MYINNIFHYIYSFNLNNKKRNKKIKKKEIKKLKKLKFFDFSSKFLNFFFYLFK